jgi:hypothetical protein
MLEPWHLPGLEAVSAGDTSGGAWHSGTTAAGVSFRTPRLDAVSAGKVAESVGRAALRARAERSLEEVIDGVARAAARLVDPAGETGRRTQETLAQGLGWSIPTVAETLRGMAAAWTQQALTGLVSSELGDPACLERFRPDPARADRLRRAIGPPLQLVVHAGNVPGVAVTAVIRGLLVRSGILNKAPADEPALVSRFARCLAEVDELLGRCVGSTWWPADEVPPAWEEWVRRSGKVVVYGGQEAVEGIRRRVPGDKDVVAYGPRLGVGVVLPDAPGGAAAALARDVCAYDQQGCVSPRIVYVIAARADGFADELAEALGRETQRLGVAQPGSGEATAIREARAAWEFGGYRAGGGARTLGHDTDLSWTVLLGDRPGCEAEALLRVIYVYPAPGVAEVIRELEPLSGRIQALGYWGEKFLDELGEGAALLGACRVAPFGSLAWPPADWRHEGRYQLLPLINWTDLELPK